MTKFNKTTKLHIVLQSICKYVSYNNNNNIIILLTGSVNIVRKCEANARNAHMLKNIIFGYLGREITY